MHQQEYLPSLNGLTSEMKIEGMSEDKKALIICVSGVRLYLELVFIEQFPIFAVLKTSLHKDAILVGGEVLPAHNLADKVHLRFKVCFRAHLITHLLQVV